MRAVSGPGGAPLASIADMVIASVNGTDVDIRKELFAGVVLTGAPSRTSGFTRVKLLWSRMPYDVERLISHVRRVAFGANVHLC